MKFLVVLACFLASAMSQRPSFAGTSPKGVPDLHPRFKQNQSDSSQTTADLGNRFGVVDGTTARLPVDARGDVNLVNRLNEWPKENRPFWLTNYEIIEQQRGRPAVGNNQSQNVGSQDSNVAGQPTGNSGSQQNGGSNQLLTNRFADVSSQPQINNNNSFSIVMNGQWRTYAYNPSSDSWVRRV